MTATLNWETFGEHDFIFDMDDGSCFYAEPELGHWLFERWTADGAMLAEQRYISFEAGSFAICEAHGFTGWTVDGKAPDLH